MDSPSPILRRFPIVLLLALPLAACVPDIGGPTPPTPTSTPAPQATMIQVSATAFSARGGVSGVLNGPCLNGDPSLNGNCGVAATATCPSGDPLLGGGYQISGGYVVSSFPSSTNAWSVTAHNEGSLGAGAPLLLYAYAECIQASFTVATHIVLAQPFVPPDAAFHSVTATCPGGTTLTGGGFQGSSGSTVSRPLGMSWQAAMSRQLSSNAIVRVFAVCANVSLSAGQDASTSARVTGSKPIDLGVGCPQGQLLAGGGYSLAGANGGFWQDAAGSNFTQWQIQAAASGGFGSGSGTATDYAVCLILTPGSAS